MSTESQTALTGPELAARTSARRRPATEEWEQHPEWHTLSRLPLRVRVEIPFPRFTVRDLLSLRAGQLVESEWSSTDDVPLIVASAQLSWAEFEVVEQRMAVRMTKLA